MLGLLELLFQAIDLQFMLSQCLLLHLLELLKELGLELQGDPLLNLLCVMGPFRLKLI